MKVLNRAALIVQPREPFLTRLHKTVPSSADITLDNLRQDPTVYLVSEPKGENSTYLPAEPARRIIFEYSVHWMVADTANIPHVTDAIT
ncbi:MAG TPA: hypothetical protein VER03_25775 [Bryobacteraceae bacterium]|nr:hypothetical protein [Bryobacteraceae bacterium]